MTTSWFTRERQLMFALLFLLGGGGAILSRFEQSFDPNVIERFPTQAFAGGKLWQLDIVATKEMRALGLGERDDYPLERGMLFLFPRSDYYGFWMEGMRFPIDIIFLSQGRIVAIERSISPADNRVVTPPEPVDQVLEVNAGEANALSPGGRVWYWRSW